MKSLLQSHKGHKVTKAKHRQMSNPTVNILQDEVNRPSLWYRAMWVNLESWRGRQRPRIGLERATRWLRWGERTMEQVAWTYFHVYTAGFDALCNHPSSKTVPCTVLLLVTNHQTATEIPSGLQAQPQAGNHYFKVHLFVISALGKQSRILNDLVRIIRGEKKKIDARMYLNLIC